MRKTARLIFIVLSVILLLSACADQKEKAEPDDFIAPKTVASELPLPENAARELAELKVPMSKDLSTLNPLAIRKEDDLNLFSLICEKAINIESNGAFMPGVIESWDLDETGHSITLHIRRNIPFHGDNGTVTADDIIYCLDVIMESDATECLYSKYKSTVGSYEKLDDATVKIDYTEPNNDIYYMLSFPVICKEYYEHHTFHTDALPVATGPYEVTSFEKGKGMHLKVNENWWREAPVYSEITAVAVADENEKIERFSKEEITCLTTGITTANNYVVQGKTNAYSYSSDQYVCLVPNMSNRFLKDVNVRLAISRAINRSNLISIALLGEGQATETPLKSDLWFFGETLSPVNGYNTGKAISILEESGYKRDDKGFVYAENKDGTITPLSIKIIYCEDPGFAIYSTMADLICEQLEAIGIRAKGINCSEKEYRQKLSERNFDLALCEFYNDQNQDISYLLNDEQCNYGGYHDEFVSQLLDNTKWAMNDKDMKYAYSRLENTWLNALPNIGLMYREHSLLLDAKIRVSNQMRMGQVYRDINAWR